MNRIEAALRGIASDLDVLHIRWALVGGFAVSVRTEPRFTRDIDVAVLVDDDPGAERLVRSLIAGHLVALKLLARDDDPRPQDAAGLRALHA
ncbi:MAG: nucleotidyl transferase AbiEii/AbiGii toxin family protein, partial [Actinomycetes bacterium]